jgi:hypothetical protein
MISRSALPRDAQWIVDRLSELSNPNLVVEEDSPSIVLARVLARQSVHEDVTER